ncbi:MAG TPA: polyphosphate kinase 2 family protein [Vicinamibacteria bacterium]
MTAFEQFRVPPDHKFKLDDRDPADTAGFKSKQEARAKERLAEGIKRLRELQERLYAYDRWALLLIFQAMDAAGKDSTIEHVMSGVNPQGCQVYSFKQPSAEELDHDYLWRTNRCLPERGRIGVFNRSYYEEVLVVRVHKGILAGEKLPTDLVDEDIWKRRFKDINAFERYLAQNGTAIVKFFLHVSKEEQRRRFLARLDEPQKNWKFSLSDVKEREHWDEYMAAYEDMLERTSTEHAPWYVIPADHKWFMRMAVADVVVSTLEKLKPEYPTITEEKRRELEAARKALEQEEAKA